MSLGVPSNITETSNFYQTSFPGEFTFGEKGLLTMDKGNNAPF